MSQTFFHLIFVVTFIIFVLIRVYYHRKARQTAGNVTFIEGKANAALRGVMGISYILLLFAYMVFPSILGFAVIPLPEWVQGAGAAVSVAVLPLIWWVQQSLGSNFATTLHVRDEHTLVTAGPYRWVRHPMYTAFFVQAVGMLLLTRNLFIGGAYLLGLTLVIITRTANEERTLLDKFGEQYQVYMQSTGRFLPKFR